MFRYGVTHTKDYLTDRQTYIHTHTHTHTHGSSADRHTAAAEAVSTAIVTP